MTTDLWRHQTRTPRPDGRLASPAPQVAPRDTPTPAPAPRSRPEHHATPETSQRLLYGFVMPLAGRNASGPAKASVQPLLIAASSFLPAMISKALNAAVHSAASLPAFRTVTLRSTTLHAYRSALSRKTAISAQRTWRAVARIAVPNTAARQPACPCFARQASAVNHRNTPKLYREEKTGEEPTPHQERARSRLRCRSTAKPLPERLSARKNDR